MVGLCCAFRGLRSCDTHIFQWNLSNLNYYWSPLHLVLKVKFNAVFQCSITKLQDAWAAINISHSRVWNLSFRNLMQTVQILHHTSSPLFQTRTSPHWRRGHSSKLQLYQHSVKSDKTVMRWECSNARAFKKLSPSELSVSTALYKSQIHPRP